MVSGPRLLPFIATIGFLGIGLCIAARAANRQAQYVVEYPFGCDTFGYLRMARQVREAPVTPWLANYHLEYDQSKWLVKALKEAEIPAEDWHELVAPHAHHYFPKADAVGPQYPPGTGFILAAFPEGQALSGLNASALVMQWVIGIGVLFLAAWKKAWLAAVCVSLATVYGFVILSKIDVLSFSINAMIVPVLLAIVFTDLSNRSPDSSWQRGVFAFVAGALLGLATLIRLPLVFLAPGLAILLLPRSWRGFRFRNAIREPVVMFCIGLLCFGIGLTMWHQHRVAGAWYLSTYGVADTGTPSLKYVAVNASYYMFQGSAMAIGHTLLAAFAIVLAATLRQKRVLLAILVMWGISTVYFLTHRVTTPYYLIPSTFATLWLIALNLISTKRASSLTFPAPARIVRALAFLGLSSLFIFFVGHLHRSARHATFDQLSPRQIPTEFQQGQPWIWADMASGTINYYGNVPTFKITFSNRETRHFVYSFAFASGEPQFLVLDCPSMEDIADEIRSMGGRLEHRGEAVSFSYYLIHWPSTGPIWVPKP